jgi:hypothetical protein
LAVHERGPVVGYMPASKLRVTVGLWLEYNVAAGNEVDRTNPGPSSSGLQFGAMAGHDTTPSLKETEICACPHRPPPNPIQRQNPTTNLIENAVTLFMSSPRRTRANVRKNTYNQDSDLSYSKRFSAEQKKYIFFQIFFPRRRGRLSQIISIA